MWSVCVCTRAHIGYFMICMVFIVTSVCTNYKYRLVAKEVSVKYCSREQKVLETMALGHMYNERERSFSEEQFFSAVSSTASQSLA